MTEVWEVTDCEGCLDMKEGDRITLWHGANLLFAGRAMQTIDNFSFSHNPRFPAVSWQLFFDRLMKAGMIEKATPNVERVQANQIQLTFFNITI